MPNVEPALEQLHAHANPANVAGMARFGMAPEQRLGIGIPELRRIARATGKDHDLALALWRSCITEARIVASLIAVPAQMTEEDVETWSPISTPGMSATRSA